MCTFKFELLPFLMDFSGHIGSQSKHFTLSAVSSELLLLTEKYLNSSFVSSHFVGHERFRYDAFGTKLTSIKTVRKTKIAFALQMSRLLI